MHNFKTSLLIAGGLLSLSPIHAEKKPNIVIIYVDDMGYGDLSQTGATGYTTPNIDNLCNEGTFFTHYYAPEAVSSASRAGLMTGCYPSRIGIKGAFQPFHTTGLNPEEEIIPEILKTKGYISGIVGKWHLGWQHKFLPLQQGFDEYYGLPYSNDMWPVDYAGKPITKEVAAADYTIKRRPTFPPLCLIEGNEKVKEIKDLDDQAQLTTLYTERAIRFIKEHKEQPFFLYLAESMPHAPIAVSNKFKGKSKMGLYGDVMMELDWSVGKVMKSLKDNGVDDNTLVIFTSDNGPWILFGDHAGSSGGLREAKTTTFEGGQRLPCIMRWKGHIPEGKVCEKLISGVDILPTLAKITGAELPENKIDGIDISDLIMGKDVTPRKYLWYYWKTNDLEALRDEQYKLVFPHDYRIITKAGINGYPGIQSMAHTDMALYDLRRDPGERYNVIDQHPAVLLRLLKEAQRARLDLGDGLTGIKSKNIRPCGKL